MRDDSSAEALDKDSPMVGLSFEIGSVMAGHKRDKLETNEKGLTVFEAALSLMSVVIGGGIVSVPFAVAACGTPFAIFINFACAGMGYLSGLLYLKAKLMCPFPVMTLYELGYLSLGEKSVYLVAIIALLSNAGCVILYFIIYGDLLTSLYRQIFSPESDSMFARKTFWIVLLSIGLLPVVLKKVISEFKAMSYFLFASLVLFILFFLEQLYSSGVYKEL
jgi:amino acid permease